MGVSILEGNKAERIASALETIAQGGSGGTIEENLLRSEIPGTSVVVTFDSNDNPSIITRSKNGSTIRTDVFTWGTDTVTEVRTLSSGESITITTNLETLAQTISEVQEVA